MVDEEKMRIEKWLKRTIPTVFEKIMHELENEPCLILESESEEKVTELTINEITSWLFNRSQQDGPFNLSTDN